MAVAETTLSDFRKAFPELSDGSDATVSYRLGVANQLFSEEVWGEEMAKHAAGLYAAHFAYLSEKSNASAGSSGIISSKSVDGVSVSFDTATGSEAGAGLWNLSPYGKELWMLMRVFGAGAYQI